MTFAKLCAAGLTLTFLTSIVVVVVPTASAATAAIRAIPCTGQNEAGLKVSSKHDTTGGRLPPESAVMKLQACARVQVEGAEACPGGVVTVSFIPDRATITTAMGSVTPEGFQTTIAFESSTPGGPAPVSGATAITLGPVTADFEVQLTRAARALTPLPVSIKAKAIGSGASTCTFKNQADETPLGTVQIVPDYLSVMFYAPEQYFAKTGQNKISLFAVKMTNLGNFPTKVSTEITESGKRKLAAVIPPGQTALESKAGNEKADNTANSIITVKTPYSNGYTNSIYTFQSKFTASANTNQAGITSKDDQTFIFSVQVQGVYVPGLDPTSVLASLGIAMLLVGIARRRAE